MPFWLEDFDPKDVKDKKILKEQLVTNKNSLVDWEYLSKALVPILIENGDFKSEEEFEDTMVAVRVAEILCPDEEK